MNNALPQPAVSTGMGISSEAFQAYLVEYQQCMESYRHTYSTIWQASALFAAIGAGVLTLGKGISHVEIIAPIPIIFWYLGIFRPMNRYGEIRNDRLAALEEHLSQVVPGLDMRHFRRYSESRKSMPLRRRLISLEIVRRPRVNEVVTAFCAGVILFEIYSLAYLAFS